ncbi:hypothetical protein M408DRAFT_332933 [Serendipita vermifera MAFF 305830]|uniref:Uncharacterized protein n=1 Tax=Serendipita vermifera MAFF 305830 TaxID=933852 RepID=A0A0C2WYN1_SERVB|nr:hypothetical protein M408DRAFT_332933 [Serendipita vermifera MAFF 305830]
MSSYWNQYPEFHHDGSAPIKKEFRRLAQLKGWVGNDPKKRELFRKEWGKCFRSEFSMYYGHDASSLAGWQSLCKEVGLDNIPKSVEECKAALKGKVWVNIVDLVDCRRTRTRVQCHESEEALREYTQLEGKVFPLQEAKANGFLTALLIKLNE